MEFFHQGDLEKQLNLPVSMLCDRDTTSIPKSQPGFISFVTPFFQSLQMIMPNLQEVLDNFKQNSKTWNKYEETEEDKKCYVKAEGEQEESKKSS